MAGLYIHIPFCEKKCIYCSFYSIETIEGKGRFLSAVVREIDMRADALAAAGEVPRLYDTIFFGGGTPSLLSPEEIGSIMAALRRRFTISDDAEITMECNPGALTGEWLEGYRSLGVNRLSFGVQSFHDDELRFLSRIHTADEARRSIALARSVFENVSLDLIFALPHQTRERWRSNLLEGIRLGTGHISAYSLIFEEGTRLNAMRLAGEVTPAPEDLDADMYEETMSTLAGHGFEQYEVSNYARPGRECRHNIGYWERRSYMAFGPSAHGFLRGAGSQVRWGNISNLSAYLGAVEEGTLPVASSEVLSPQLIIEEIIFLGLRSSGIMLDEFQKIAGIDLADIAAREIAAYTNDGYVLRNGGRLMVTRKGYAFADRIALELISAVERGLPTLMKPRLVLPSLTVVASAA
ncbi:MAG: radical SAM family heme chaperone HemW [Bacteroidota bacterium]